MLTDDQMMERMINGWRAGKPFTICGNGSLPENTANILTVLPLWIDKYQFEVVNDAGAGDLQWRHGRGFGGVTLRNFDLVPRAEGVTRLDITTEIMPLCDLILCRMVLNHLDAERIDMALERFRLSGKYLAATQFDGENLPQRSPQFKRLDLRGRLGEPIESTRDGGEDICRLCLWKI